MSKKIFELERALLQIIEIPLSSKFAIEEDGKKGREYFKAAYLEIEDMIYNYQENLCAKFKDQITFIIKESKTIYTSITNINNIIANIWISYLDCYSLILTCEIKTDEGIIVKHTRDLMMVYYSNNERVKIPKSIIKEFVNCTHSKIRQRY